jgi:hypothetical protein
VSRIGVKRGAYKILVEKGDGNAPLETLHLGGKIILKHIFKK